MEQLFLVDNGVERLAHDDVDMDIELPDVPTQSLINGSYPSGTHPAELVPAEHYHGFHEFRDTANQALHAAFPVHRQPRNATASVLMLKWADDDLGVTSELTRLKGVFDQYYHFETEIWEIQSQKSARRLSDKVHEWRDQCCEEQVCPGGQLPLMILYYGGHAEQSANNICRWRSNLNQTTSSSLNWTTTQQVLFDDADADVLIFLDCCYAASARFRAASTGKGTKEILAACSNRLPTTGVEYRSFTSVLTDELKEAAIENQLRGSSLSVVELHGIMHDNRKLQYQPIYARVSRNRYHTISLIPFRDATRLHCEAMTPNGSTTSASSPQLRINIPTRVLLSIHTSRSPTEDLICFLKNECMLPLYVMGMKIEEVVRMEGIYESNSTLTLVSIPLPVWDLIPDHTACHYVGLIRSENLCQRESVQQLFTQVKSHSASATSSSVGPRQQPTWSDCSSYSGSSPPTQLRGTRTESYTEPILTPQDSSEGSSSHEMLSADNAHDRSLTGLEKVGAPSSLGAQSGLQQSYESSVAFRDLNGICKDIDVLESTDLENNAFNSSRIEPDTERFMDQESLLNASTTHGSRQDDWHGTAEEHQDNTYYVSDSPFDAPYANTQPGISKRIAPRPTRAPASLSPWNEWALRPSYAQSQLDDVVGENDLFRHSHPDDPGIGEGLFQKSQPDCPSNENHLFQRLTSQEHDSNGDEMGGVQHWVEQLDEFVVAVEPDSPQEVAADGGFDQGSELATASRPSSPGSWSIGSTMASVVTGPSKLGRRMGRVIEFGRQNAKAIRGKGSCFRCFLMSERCVLDEHSANDGICQRCRKLGNSNNYRTWGLTCSEIGLDQRGIFMLPKVLVFPLTGGQLRDFVKENVQSIVPNSSIKLALTIGFGEPLRLNAVEIVPRGQGAIRMLGFTMSSRGQTIALELGSPPVIPFLTDRVLIERHINGWLDKIIREEDSELPEHCFPEARERWLREILTIICRYHREHLPNLETEGHGAYQTLRWALKLTVLNHIMCHPFVVPDDEVGALDHQLQNYRVSPSAKWICPRLANKIIKHMLVPMLKRTIDRVLGGLQKVLRTRGDDSSRWDQAFCVVFLCLIVMSKAQASLVERAIVGSLNNDDSFTLDAAASEAAEMEAELSTHLIGMFHDRFGTTRKSSAKGKVHNPISKNPRSRPSFVSRFADSIGSATATYGSHNFEIWDLDKWNPEKMKEQNDMRLLAKFMQPFFLDAEFEERAKPGEVQMETARSEKAQPEEIKSAPYE